jgi:tetratricopeptide (TPR) repeat protein
VSYAEVVSLLRQALAIDPSYAPAQAMLAWCPTQQRAQGWRALSDADLADSVRLARRSVEAGRDDPDILKYAAWTLFRFAGETAMATALLDRAVALNPNLATAWVCKGFVHAMRNQPQPAIDALDRARRLSPLDPLDFFCTAPLPTLISSRAASKRRLNGPTAHCMTRRVICIRFRLGSPRMRISAASTKRALNSPDC